MYQPFTRKTSPNPRRETQEEMSSCFVFRRVSFVVSVMDLERQKREFVGIQRLSVEQSKQLTRFERWAAAQTWKALHSAHYDWWMFPLDETSSFGYKYTVNPENVQMLLSDTEFVQRLRRGAIILAESYGWDLEKRAPISKPNADAGQAWQSYPVRLFKAGRSMIVFGQRDLYDSFVEYAKRLRSLGCSLKFSSSSRSGCVLCCLSRIRCASAG